VVDRCVTTMITEAERHIADEQTQANHKKVMRLIQSGRSCRLVPQRHYPTHAVSRAQTARGHPQRAGRGGELVLEIRETERRPAAVYRAVAT
jgi:hypothetical protein